MIYLSQLKRKCHKMGVMQGKITSQLFYMIGVKPGYTSNAIFLIYKSEERKEERKQQNRTFGCCYFI